MLKKLLIATSNVGKVEQYRAGLSGLPLELITLKDIALGLVEETGATFAENALLKARACFKQSGLPCVADDGGLEIDALGGKPGVYSRRWKTGDESATDKELIDFTIEQMQQVPEGERSARFKMAMVFIDKEGGEHIEETSTEGYIPLEASPIILPWLPFDSVLYIPQFGKIRSELTKEEHELVNQRVLAIKKLRPVISAFLA